MITSKIFITLLFLTPFLQADIPGGISVPKSGTHLLMKLERKIFPQKKVFAICNYHPDPVSTPNTNPRFNIDEQCVKNAQEHGGFLRLAHAWYTIPKNREIIRQYDVRAVFLYRDPRDQIVSQAYWIKKKQPKLEFVSIEEMITMLICSREQIKLLIDPNALEVTPNNCRDYLMDFLPWKDEPNILGVRFEDLIGSKGGGDDLAQKETIQAIATFWEQPLSEERLQKISNELFGNSTTFRKGIIGDWKSHFTPFHTEQFKAIAGDLLIELGYEANNDW